MARNISFPTISTSRLAEHVAPALRPPPSRRALGHALNQGATAGRNAAGGREVYERLPYFFSDQYDLGMEYVGRGSASDSVVIRGDRDGREFIAFWHRDGHVSAAMNVNVWDVVDEAPTQTTRTCPSPRRRPCAEAGEAPPRLARPP